METGDRPPCTRVKSCASNLLDSPDGRKVGKMFASTHASLFSSIIPGDDVMIKANVLGQAVT